MVKRALAGTRSLQPLAFIAAAVGTAVVVTFSLLTLAVHQRTEQHLLDLQVREAALTVAASLPTIQSELDDGLQVARASNSPSTFVRFASARILSNPSYDTASLWRQQSGSVREIVGAGSAPALLRDGRVSFLSSLRPAPGLQVTGILPDGSGAALGIAQMPANGGGMIAYTETNLPPGRHISVPHTNPFHNIQFALYLNSVAPQNLLESTTPNLGHGRRAVAVDPFGNATIVMVGISTTDLSGSLLADLPWIVLGVGLALSVATAVTAELLGRRRTTAETLAAENQRLYLEQRDLFTTVQHALLPDLPELPGLEVGARYLAGTAGIEVGGDWYDLVQEGDRCTFVVGDVCGRGMRAATTMASLRFATRAYIAQGDCPEIIVDKLGRLQDFDSADEMFATLLIGQIDLVSRRVRMVSAGHPPPLLIDGSGATFVAVVAGSPVGVAQTPVGVAQTPMGVTQTPVAVAQPPVLATEFSLPEDGLLIAYTDGLVEHRDRPLTEGMEQLRRASVAGHTTMEQFLDRLVANLLPAGAVDDTAILALRWRRVSTPSG